MLAHFHAVHWPRIRTLIRWGAWLAAILLALTLVFYVIALQLFARIGEYKPPLEARLSAAVSAPVTIRQLEATWHGLRPEFTLSEVRVLDPARPEKILLAIPRIQIEPALRQSLLQLSPRFHIRIDGLSVSLSQSPGGAWQLDELAALPPGSAEARRRALKWVLSQAEWRLADGRLRVTALSRPPVILQQVDITNRNGRSRHQLRLNGELGGWGPVRLMANMDADEVLQPAQWSGTIYASLPKGDWSTWLPVHENLQAGHFNAGAEAWLELGAGVIDSAYVRLQAAQLDAVIRNRPFRVENAWLNASFRRSNADWELALMPQSGTLNSRPFPAQSLMAGKREAHYFVTGHGVQVQNLATLVRDLELPETIGKRVRELNPSGYLPVISVQLLRAGQSWSLQGLQADVRQLSWSATTEIPGATGVSGWVRWQDGHGNAAINMRGGMLDLRQVFREPVPVNVLTGHFSFTRNADAWLVRSDHIALATPDAAGEALLSFWIPHQHPENARMQLLAGIHDGKVASVWRYVPWPSAGDDTLAWLKASLRDGRLRQGDFLYEGPLIDRPGEEPSSMQMRFQLEDAVLAYAPGWPEIRKLQAEVTINNRHLQVRAHQGQVYESIARNVVADIPELRSPVLQVDADLDSTGDDVFRLFRESPLKAEAGRMADLLAVKGELNGHLSLKMPLSDTDKAHVRVDAELPGNPIMLKEAGPFDLWLNGLVNYETGKGFTSQPMTGFFLGQPLSIRFSSVLDEGNVVAVQIQADGSLTPVSLRPWIGSLGNHMRGSTRFKAFLAVPIKDAPVHLALDADLAGWNMDLPEPFTKKAEPLPLHFEMQLDGKENLSFLTLENKLQSLFAFSGGRITRMLVQLGEGRIGELPPQGLWIRGNLPRLDLDSWLPWLRPQGGRHEPGNSDLPEVESFTLSVKELLAGGYRLPQARLGAEPVEESDGGGWRIQIESERITGEARIPSAAARPVAVTLYRLTLPLMTASGPAAGPESSWEIPAINLDIKSLSYLDWPALGKGTLTAMIRPTADGVRVDNLLLKHDAVSFSGKAGWQYHGQHNTRIQGTVKAGDVARIFSAFEYPAVLTSDNTVAAVSLAWPGDPTDMALKNLSGEVNTSLEKGRLLKLNRAVSLTRLFGVLDTDNLKRRIQLDFSDITRRGMAFDDLTVDARFGGGVLQDSFSLNSPSMTVSGAGSVNLTDEHLDQRIQIAVPLASAVPIAAALVAGPVIGGALVAAETVFDDSLRKMTAFNYQVRGSWTNPVIERVRKPLIPWRLPRRKPLSPEPRP